MKKNVLSIILIFAVVFSLALVSCGSDEPEQSTADSSKTEVSKQEQVSDNQEEVSNSVPKITDSLYANADKTILSPGDTVTIKVGFNSPKTDTALGVDYKYDKEFLTLTKLDWLLEDALLSDSTIGEVAVIAYEDEYEIKGDFIEFSFTVNESAEAGKASVTITALLGETHNDEEHEITIEFEIQK